MKMELLKRGLKRSFIDEVVSGISVDQRELAQRLSESYQRRSSYRRSKNPQASLMRHLVSKGISFDVAREMTKRRVDFS
jgi:SOS response regulatory protein OraA/RecX